MGTGWSDAREIQVFRDYLKIPSVHPNIDYGPCVRFLQIQAALSSLSYRVIYPGGPKKPIVLMTWKGTDSRMPSILLNSHMDVVPADSDNWKYPPFSATMDSEGRIYARGTQDMKSVGLQYLAAIRRLRRDGVKLKRTIHVSFVPDEEIGGVYGMQAFVKSKEFQALNVGFALDEGGPSEADYFGILYAERSIWHITLVSRGPTGHGSTLFENTSGEKLNRIIAKFMDYRQSQMDILDANPDMFPSAVTSVNLTVLRGGEQINVIPSALSATFDIRISLNETHEGFEKKINDWCKEVGENIDIYFNQKDPPIEPTKIDDTNPFWVAMRDALTKDMQLKYKTVIATGGTDARYLRQLNIPAFGFSPINNTPSLIHADNEYLGRDTYLRGIDIYKAIIKKIGDVPEQVKQTKMKY